MFGKMLEDLRFFIGSFFLIIGAVLIAQGIFSPSEVDGYNLNLIVGCCFVAFALMALTLVLRGLRQS